MYNILNSISPVNLYTELATVIRLAVVVVFFLIWHPDVYNCHNNNNNTNNNNFFLNFNTIIIYLRISNQHHLQG